MFRRWRPKMVMVERHVELLRCRFQGRVEVGFRSYATDSFFRNASIGRFCSIGRRVSIGAKKHRTDLLTTHPIAGGADDEPRTVIGHDVWIGDNAVIMAGLTVGHGAVIGAGAIVTKDVEPYTIMAGAPAREIGQRFTAELRQGLLESQWWGYGDVAAVPDPEAAIRLARTAEPLPPHHRRELRIRIRA